MTYIRCTSKDCDLNPFSGFLFEAKEKCAGCEYALEKGEFGRWVPYRGKAVASTSEGNKY